MSDENNRRSSGSVMPCIEMVDVRGLRIGDDFAIIAGPSGIYSPVNSDLAKMLRDSGVNVLKGDVYSSGRLDMKALDGLLLAGVNAKLPVMARADNAEDAKMISKHGIDIVDMRLVETDENVNLVNGSAVLIGMEGAAKGKYKNRIVSDCGLFGNGCENYTFRVGKAKGDYGAPVLADTTERNGNDIRNYTQTLNLLSSNEIIDGLIADAGYIGSTIKINGYPMNMDGLKDVAVLCSKSYRMGTFSL